MTALNSRANDAAWTELLLSEPILHGLAAEQSKHLSDLGRALTTNIEGPNRITKSLRGVHENDLEKRGLQGSGLHWTSSHHVHLQL